MDLTYALANELLISPFEVMAQDIDDVILIVNYRIFKAENTHADETEKSGVVKHNDGFWDF